MPRGKAKTWLKKAFCVDFGGAPLKIVFRPTLISFCYEIPKIHED
jgi:hypothetical protein